MSSEEELFQRWKKELDRVLIRNMGIKTSDLPDRPYRKWFEYGHTPGYAAYKAIRGTGYDHL